MRGSGVVIAVSDLPMIMKYSARTWQPEEMRLSGFSANRPLWSKAIFLNSCARLCMRTGLRLPGFDRHEIGATSS